MEGYDVLTDSYAGEMTALILLERIWDRISKYLSQRDAKKEEKRLDDKLAELERKIAINTELDKERAKAKQL